jgi:hypothetical protein
MAIEMPTQQTHLRLSLETPAPAAFSFALNDGYLSLPIVIENVSQYPAQLPFLCLMDLGLNLIPQLGWRPDKIASDGRRLVRFAFTDPQPLPPGGRLHAVNVVAKIVMNDGIVISFNGGVPVALEALRDLRMFSVTGAANFPAARGHVVVAADTIRQGLTQAMGGGFRQRLTG